MLKTTINFSFLSLLHHNRKQREVQLERVERTSLFSPFLNYTNNSSLQTYKNLNYT